MAKKSFFNADFLPIIRKQVKKLRANDKKPFSTIQLIKEYVGSYQIDKTSAHDSINANIGKFLQENSKALGIQEKRPKKTVTIKGERTSTSIWEFI